MIGFYFYQMCCNNKKEAVLHRITSFCRGENRIRTGVRGFADRCLASRPSRLFEMRLQRYSFFGENQNIFDFF